MAHSSGSRFGAFASKSFPRIFALTERAHEEGSETLRETCLRTIERFVLSCPGSITEQLPIVVATSLALMTHDPLYGDDGGGESATTTETTTTPRWTTTTKKTEASTEGTCGISQIQRPLWRPNYR